VLRGLLTSWMFEGRDLMVATVATVAYLGLEARAVEVQVQLSPGLGVRRRVEPKGEARRGTGAKA